MFVSPHDKHDEILTSTVVVREDEALGSNGSHGGGASPVGLLPL
jgi:hypothetical protein